MFGLAVLILLFGPVSGAHFNPVVSAADWLLGRRAGTGISASHVASYTVAQITGGVVGAVLANIMFDRQVFEIATKDRITTGHLVGEVVATAGLIALIFALARTGRAALSAAAVGAYIGAAYWFTSSTSFANPAVTVGRMFSDTFAGIAPGSVPGFIAAQIVGGLLGLALIAALYPDAAATAERRRRRAPRRNPPHRTTEFDMTDSPVPLAKHLRPDLSVDQQLALRTAATRLHAEFGEHFGVETIERFLHSSYDQFAGRATVPNFLPLLAERLARQRLTALARVEGKITDTKPTVLFLCTHNAGRSQMALGYFNHLAGDQGVAWSGGSEPGNEINPSAVAGDGRGRHRHHRRIPQTLDRRDRAGCRCRHHDGLRGRLPVLPRKTLRELGTARPRWPVRRRGPPDPRRYRGAGPPAAGRPQRRSHPLTTR